MTDHYEDDSEDDGFLEWFIRNTYEEAVTASYRLVLPDSISFGLAYEAACYQMERAIKAAGGNVWAVSYAGGGAMNYYIVDEAGQEIFFATIEPEGE